MWCQCLRETDMVMNPPLHIALVYQIHQNLSEINGGSKAEKLPVREGVVYEDRARRYVCERFKCNKFADREERSVIIFYKEMDIITDKQVWSVIIK